MDVNDDLELSNTLRSLSACSRDVPKGMTERVFQSSVPHLPNQAVIGRIGSRTSLRWRAAAAILILAGGAILAWQTSGAREEALSDGNSLAAVLEASSDSSEDENFIGLASAQGADLDDLAFEMRSVLRNGQAGR